MLSEPTISDPIVSAGSDPPLDLDLLLAWRDHAYQEAQAAGIERIEVDWLLEQVLSWSKLDQVLQRSPSSKPVSKADLERLDQLWQRRSQDRCPIQYLVGWTHWREIWLEVTPAVLIPRPETELLIEIARSWWQTARSSRPFNSYPADSVWVDLGTGSGAIAIGLADAIPALQLVGVDLSAEALAVAQKNVERLGLTHQIQLLQGDWFEALAAYRGRIQAMIANPPYIPSDQIDQLQPEVRRHEPRLALEGGASGLEIIEHLWQTAPDYIHSGGLWAVEVMQGQAPTVAAALDHDGRYTAIQIHSDLAGIERFVSAEVIE